MNQKTATAATIAIATVITGHLTANPIVIVLGALAGVVAGALWWRARGVIRCNEPHYISGHIPADAQDRNDHWRFTIIVSAEGGKKNNFAARLSKNIQPRQPRRGGQVTMQVCDRSENRRVNGRFRSTHYYKVLEITQTN